MWERTYTSRSKDILGKDNALRLNNEEVDELMDIRGQTINAVLWQSVILSGADLGGEAF